VLGGCSDESHSDLAAAPHAGRLVAIENFLEACASIRGAPAHDSDGIASFAAVVCVEKLGESET